MTTTLTPTARAETKTTFAARLAWARQSREMTQYQVADLAEMTQGAVSRLERGQDVLLATWLRVARALQVHPAWLVGEGELMGAPAFPLELRRLASMEREDLARWVSERVRLTREARGLNQHELAAATGGAVSQASMSLEGTAALCPRLSTLVVLAQGLAVPVSWLLSGDSELP